MKTQAKRIGTKLVNGVPRKAVWAVWHGNEYGTVWTAEVQIHLDGDEALAIAAVRH